MNEELYSIILDRLERSRLRGDVEAIILAACEGAGELEAHLGGGGTPAPRRPRTDHTTIPGIYLTSVEVQGFRGVGPRAVLEIPEGPGLTLVVGRNGSGKSSLAEALDYSFTGSVRRWVGKGAQSHWRDGWRNLHFEGPTEILTRIRLEASAKTSALKWTWSAGSELDGGKRSYWERDEEVPEPDWKEALASFRPFLSYSELGQMLEGRPVDFYKALSAGLGLEELEQARDEIRQVRLDSNRSIKAAQEGLEPILDLLKGVDDPRATACLAALTSRRWDLDAVEKVIAGGETESEQEMEVLRQLRVLAGPEPEQISDLCDRLRKSAEQCASIAGSEAEKDLAVAEVLERALAIHDLHGDQDCPVCGTGTLDRQWRVEAQARVGELRRRAQQVQTVLGTAQAVQRESHDFFGSRPLVLDRAVSEGIDLDLKALVEAWEAWLGKAEVTDLEQLAACVQERGRRLIEALQSVREAAGRELDRRQSAWLPVARDLNGWLPGARAALKKSSQLDPLKAAEDWLRSTTGEIQHQRFQPIAKRASYFWSLLRQQSNVDLREICLAGTGSHGKVELEVTVDGRRTAALGVMSQGELFSLALSLFLPRATRDDSPFRFLVIDDPVQSMDPARVDGLARVLEECARDRQVVVFTHDSRLSQSVRRLDIKADIVEVVREPDSRIHLEPYSDTVMRYLDDARALLGTVNLPAAARQRAIPVLCRMALEAACEEALRRRYLAEGVSHVEIERLLESAPKLSERAAHVLSSDPNRLEDVTARLRNIGPWAVDTFQKVNRGAHAEVDEDFQLLVNNTEKLAGKLRRAK